MTTLTALLIVLAVWIAWSTGKAMAYLDVPRPQVPQIDEQEEREKLARICQETENP